MPPSAIHFPFEPGKTHTIGELRDFERALSLARQSDADLSKAWRVPATDEMKRWCKLREETYPIKLLAEHHKFSNDMTFRLMPHGYPSVDAEITSGAEHFNLQITIADPTWIGQDGLAQHGGYDHRLVMEELNKSGVVHGSASMRRKNGKIVSGLPVKSFEEEFLGCRQGLVTAFQRKLGGGVKVPKGAVLGYELIRVGANNPALGNLVEAVEAWVKGSFDQAKETPASRRFSVVDWEIELELFVLESMKDDGHAIGISHGAVEFIAPHEDLRRALYRKSRKYGTMDAPYLIVVADSKGQIAGADSIKNALTQAVFGDEVVHLRGNEPPRITYANNGFWWKRDGSHNKHVSAIMLFPDPGLWALRSENHQPTMAINPWGDRFLPEVLKVFPRYEADGPRWLLNDGKTVADVLGLPTPWPPADD